MNNRLIWGLLLILMLPAVLIPLNSAWVRHKDFAEFEQYFEQVSLAIGEIEAAGKPPITADYRRNIEQWNRQTGTSMSRVYAAFGNGQGYVKAGKDLTKKIFETIYSYNTELATIVEPLFSEKMRDHGSLKNKDAYDWRMQTLANISQSLDNYQHSHNIVNVVRQAIIDSELPENYREYVWREWTGINRNKLTDMMPNVDEWNDLTVASSKYYQYLYSHQDGFHVTQTGDVVVTNNRYQEEYRALAGPISNLL